MSPSIVGAFWCIIDIYQRRIKINILFYFTVLWVRNWEILTEKIFWGSKIRSFNKLGFFGIFEGNFELIWSISIVIMCHDVSLCTNVIIWILYGYKELQNGTSVDPVPVSLSPLGPLYELFSKSLCQDRMMDWIRSLSGN